MKSMKNWALVGLTVFFGLLGSLIFNFTGTAIAQEKSPEQPQPQPGQTVEKPKPYGCFKDLKWGMTTDEADKSLGAKLKRWPIKIKGESTTYGDMPIGEKKYSIMLDFNSSGLFRVRIEPRIYEGSVMGLDDYKAVGVLLDSYNILKPALVDKFGKPKQDTAQDRGSDVDFANNLLNHKASIMTIWETDESLITLRVETKTVSYYQGKRMVTYEPLLVYEKIIPKQEKKVEL